MNLCVVCCLHGNETYGLDVVEQLPARVPFFIGNAKAIENNTRFIECDLNRCFPGKEDGLYEERIAYRFVKSLEKFDRVIDLHSSSNNCPLFGIVTKPNKEKIEFANSLGLSKLVIMSESFASGKALIDFTKCGISLEIGPHDDKKNAEEVLKLINNYLEKGHRENKMKVFEVKKALQKIGPRVHIKNFEKIKKGQLICSGERGFQYAEENFIPVLVNEKAYGDVLCLVCKELSKKDVEEQIGKNFNKLCEN